MSMPLGRFVCVSLTGYSNRCGAIAVGVCGARVARAGGELWVRDQADGRAVDQVLLDDLAGADLSRPGAARGGRVGGRSLGATRPPPPAGVFVDSGGGGGAPYVAAARRTDAVRAARH